MFAVLFRAEIKLLDAEYTETAEQLRALAFAKYNCIDFVSTSKGTEEIAISHWHSLEDIHAWKQEPLHAKAQKLGRERWYHSYRVQITEVVREYTG